MSNKNEINQNLDIPKTIEELKKWYKNMHLPNENISRFFIGKNYKEAQAFGIYYDKKTKNFVVYKNKSDGNRLIRYNGPDEEFAVNELFLRLKQTIANEIITQSEQQPEETEHSKEHNRTHKHSKPPRKPLTTLKKVRYFFYCINCFIYMLPHFFT